MQVARKIITLKIVMQQQKRGVVLYWCIRWAVKEKRRANVP